MKDLAGMDRRTLLGLAGGAALTIAASPGFAASADRIGNEIIPLWPGLPPGSTDRRPAIAMVDHSDDAARPDRTVTGVGRPEMVVFRPAKPNGGAVLVMPGGGYEYEAFDNEGTRQAAWLNANGITAFVLVYRLPAEGWVNRSLVPLQDAQRAMRLIRASAARFAVDGDRVAALGFSAGGHLAGSLLTRSAEASYGAVDDTDRLSATPRFAGLVYPVITMHPAQTHAGSRAALIGKDADEAAASSASVDENVGEATPPCIIVHTNDDPIVPVANARLMYDAMRRHDRPVAMHLFESGGHGFGINHPASEPVSIWPQLFLAFARAQGLF